MPDCVNSFKQAVQAVLGQLLSMKMASTFPGRLAQRGYHLRFPRVACMALQDPEEIHPLGVQLKRTATLFGIAQAFNEKRLQLDKVLAIVQGITALAAASCIAMCTWS